MSLQKLRRSDNFKWNPTDFIEVTNDLIGCVTFDDRNSVVSFGTDLSDFEWYFNYLDIIVKLCGANPKNRVHYLLELGYIPLVALPTCFPTLETPMMQRLDRIGLPYVKMPQYAFDGAYKYDLSGIDAWVSKLDVEKVLGIPYKDVRLVDTARRVFSG